MFYYYYSNIFWSNCIWNTEINEFSNERNSMQIEMHKFDQILQAGLT